MDSNEQNKCSKHTSYLSLHSVFEWFAKGSTGMDIKGEFIQTIEEEVMPHSMQQDLKLYNASDFETKDSQTKIPHTNLLLLIAIYS